MSHSLPSKFLANNISVECMLNRIYLHYELYILIIIYSKFRLIESWVTESVQGSMNRDWDADRI